MKKVFKFFRNLLILLAVLIIALIAVVEGYSRINDKVEDEKIAGSEKWMADLSDDLLLSQISIPGVHDAGANNVRLSLFSKCQDLSTKELLNDGFRYLDIRLGIDYVCNEPVMSIYHGFVHCLKADGTYLEVLYLDEILAECYEFLDENPSETIIFVVKKEHGEESVSEFEELLNTYTDNSKWLLTDKMPSLGEARGKIVLFRRYEDEASLGKTSGIHLSWAQQKENDDVSKTYELYENGRLKAYVQDRYKYDTDAKWFAFFDTEFDTVELLEEGLVLNFLSTNGTPTYGHPYKYAKELNAKFMEMNIVNNTLGWVVVDFGNAELAEKIYDCNFK